MNLFIKELFNNPAYYFSVVVAFMGSICFHEFCHATVAHHLGDDTARNGGFQTLNPFKVMGWQSILCLLVFGFSWGAVPVMATDNKRWRKALISITGPLSNLLLLLLSSLALKALQALESGSPFLEHAYRFLLYLLYSNAILFLFNILPIPPLDGWCSIEAFLPARLVPSPETKGKVFMVFFYLIFISSSSGIFSNVFDKCVGWLAERFLPRPSAGESLVEEGSNCLNAGDYAGAYEAFSKAAEQGSIEGKLLHAQCLSEGWGCKPDQARAFEEFSKDEYSKYPLARFYHGLLLAFGMGCEQNAEKGYELLSQSDVQKYFPIARAITGVMLAEGMGIEQDFEKAFRLLDDDEALEEFPRATHYLVALLLVGKGCEKNPERAFALLSDPKVWEGVPAAQFQLGVLYYSGEGGKQDFKKAAEHIKAAADAGSAEAMEFLGYEDGKYVDCGIPLEELLRQRWVESRQSGNTEDAP